MVFTTLELTLGGTMLSLVVAVATHLLTRAAYVTCRQCEARHQVVREKFAEHDRRYDEILSQNSKLFSMVKALIVYTKDVPDDVRAKLVSEGGVR